MKILIMINEIILFIKKEKIIFWILISSIIFSLIFIFTNRIPELFLYWKEIMLFLYSISISIIATIIFYIFQIYIPNIKKTKKIVKVFHEQYKYFKLDTIQIFIWVLNENNKEPEDLIDLDDFKKYFKSEKWDMTDNWSELINRIEDDDNDEHFQDLVFQIELLHKKINLLLLSIDLPDDVFSFFHRLDETLSKLKYIRKDSERYQNDYKIFWRTLWEIFTGWSNINWYSNIDFVKKNLDKV